MGVESVSFAGTLEISCHSPTRELLPALESMESKRHTSYRSHSTNVYIQNHRSTELKVLGKTARIQIVLFVIQNPTNRNPAQSLQENAITVFGPRLYNSLPKYLRDIESGRTEKFIFELDKFLEFIPDQAKIPNSVTAAGSNSILDKLTHLRAQGIYKVVESPTRAWSSLSCFEAIPSIQSII